MDLRRVQSALSCPLEPGVRHTTRYRQASVLVAVYGREPRVLMTKKTGILRIHAGEISFPGGKHDGADSDLLDTALRETLEEVGLSVPRSMVVGQLAPVVTLNSGYMITPFVAVPEDVSGLRANAEVEEILEIPLAPLLATLDEDRDPDHRSAQAMYTFTFEGRMVWGATSRILYQIAGRLGV